MATSSNASIPDHPGLRLNRACRSCVQIKAKCIPLDQSMSTCQRCHRLGKYCSTPAPVPRKGARSKPQQQDTDRATALLTPSSLEDVPTILTGSPNISRNSAQQALDLQSPAKVNNPWYLSRAGTKHTGTVFDISPELAHNFIAATHEDLFEHYTSKMAKYFPFVVFPPTTTPAAVFKERPFLYTCCVLNASYRDPPLQSRIGRDVMRYVCEHMFISGEKNLDFLQGLLVICAWYHIYTHNNPQLMNVFHLARALLVDLGLNGTPGIGAFRIKWTNDAIRMAHGASCLPPEPHDHSMEERRVCLAVYYMHARYAGSFRRLDPTVWTEYLDDCCTTIEKANEYPTDAYAVALARLSHLVERYTNGDGFQPGLSMPVQTYTKLVSKEMDQFIQHLPIDLQIDQIMKVQLANAEVSLLEPVILSNDSSPVHRVEALYYCLKANTNFFDTFNAVENEEMPRLPFLVWIMVAQALDVMATLSFTTFDGWDLEYVRNTPGFIALNVRMMEKMRQVQLYEETNYPRSRSVRFQKFRQRLEMFMQWYEEKVQLESNINHQASVSVNSSEQVPDQMPPAGDFSDLLWADFMADWPRLENELSYL